MSLVVEYGSGMSTAESYISVLDADAYLAKQADPVAWSGATVPDKENALRQATTYIDQTYARQFKGSRAKQEQALRWPRVGAIDVDGFVISGNEIPSALKRATAELAAEIVGGTSPYVTETSPGETAAESITVGPISISETAVGGKGQQPLFTKVAALLSDLIEEANIRKRA